MSNAASVKDKLKNQSQKTGKTMQELLVAYGLERAIYRLSVSRYKENFTLKGGIFLYALFDGNYARATTDIDFLAHKVSNKAQDIMTIFEEVFAIETGDPLKFDLSTLNVKTITEFKKYHGLNISIFAFLEKTKIPISIDIGFGDVLYPGRIEMGFPTVLDDDIPKVYVYSLASSIAEKFEAIVSLGYENSRFKDYYDLYVLATTHDINGEELIEAIKDTFENRHTSLKDIVAFESGFTDDLIRQSRWKAFIKKKKALLSITLDETIDVIKSFLSPISDAIISNDNWTKEWNHTSREWK